MAIEFTRQQQKVLNARGHNVLVSAAAGSGKTAVLVERIIREISEPGPGGARPLDIDRLLVVTFTRAAAAQMREKIARAVSARLEKNPGDRHLQRQETLLHHAQITTIDSFCSFLLRNNFSEIGLDPGFRQMDETENTLLENDVMQRYLEEKYTEKSAGFLRCVEYFCPGSNDDALEGLILRLYRTADSHPYPAAWLEEHCHDYDVKDERDLLRQSWYRELLLEQKRELPELLQLQRAMVRIAEEPDGPFPYLEVLEREEEELTALAEKAERLDPAEKAGRAEPAEKAEGTDPGKEAERTGPAEEAGRADPEETEDLRRALQAIAAFPLTKLPVIRNAEGQGIRTDRKALVQTMRRQMKSRLESMKNALAEDPALTVSRMAKAAEPVHILTDLTLGYMEALDQEKKKRNVISFSDLEHDALDILIDRAEDGTLTLRKAAEEYRRHFAEVLVDEYQDSNEVQELLLSAITGEKDAGFVMEGPGHYARFMVGDVKQSIYRFRNARPEIFQRKFDTYTPCCVPQQHPEENFAEANSPMGSRVGAQHQSRSLEDPHQRNFQTCVSDGPAEPAETTEPADKGPLLRERIDLDQNFRSRREVLDAVNGVFTGIMRREIGGVEYDETVSLKPGARYPEPVPERDGSDPYQAELLIVDGADHQDEGTEGTAGENVAGDGASVEGATGRNTAGNGAAGDAAETGPDEADGMEDEIRELSGRRKEALAVAQRIREIVGRLPVTDPDSGEQRMARYGDIVILLRSTSGRQDAFREIFEKEGIPLYLEYKGGYFSAEEVRQVLQVLRVIDNPRQDIPLYGAMRGYFGGFTQDEIGQIRALGLEVSEENRRARRNRTQPDQGEQPDQEDQNRAMQLYDCLLEASNPGSAPHAEIAPGLREKCRAFLAWLEAYRRKVPTTPIHELIGELVRSTGYEDYVRALPAGQRRAANLHSLLVKAAAFEQTDYAGLFRFLRYIDQMHEFDVDYGEASALDEHADVVRLTTIHKSKGLEYPICFVCGLGARHPFARDMTGMMITDSDLGIGVNYVDTDLRSQTQTLRQKAVAGKIGRDALGEELRVLYVAMTRAKEKLILTGFVRDSGKFLENTAAQLAAAELPASHLPVSLIRGAGGYLPLVMESIEAMRAAGETPIRVRTVPMSDLALSKVEEQLSMGQLKNTLALLEEEGPESLPVPVIVDRMSAHFSWRYPHENRKGLFTKTTVSELKHAAMLDAGALEEDRAPEGADELYPDRAYVPGDALPEPRFAAIQEEQQEGPTARSPLTRGTAVHRMCELIDYHAWKDPSSVTAQEFRDRVNELAGKGTIPPEYGPLLRAEVFLPFLKSDIAARMAAADAGGLLRREQPFVLGIAANRLKPEFPAEETILIQGIIDAFFLEDDRTPGAEGRHIVVVDYKTDRVRTARQLIDRYQVQLNYYAEALERMLHLPVREKIIYSFWLGREILLS